ncbi:MAG: UDP-N-acetylglucosamine diphosphorylase [Simkaniaceae bacterium]|nr:MAG: UDP-N-acetylglucosamine diphosphorylase [Simkaniaceae bacterium]
MPTPERFFDLQDFLHKDLFKLGLPIWDSLKALKSYLDSWGFGEIECAIPEGVTLVNPGKISIGKGTRIESGSYIEGPCIIGEDSQVRHGAYVRPYVLTGKRCIIGHSTEVKHSILLDGAQAPHFNYVGDSILGKDVNLGAGVICANFRLDRGEVIVEVDGKRFKTDLRKFGAVLGDLSQIGCNSVLNPGVLLHKRTFSRACSSIQKSNVRNLKNVKAADSS